MDSKTIRRINLQALVRQYGSKTELATLCGVSASNLSQVDPPDGGEPIRNIGHVLARKLERGTKKPRGWMDTIHEVAEVDAEAISIRRVPLREWRDVSGSADETARAGADSVPADSRTTPEGSFGLRVRGDSMVNPAGNPSYPPGCVIIVDPDREPQDGNRVIVQIPGVSEATFKVYTVDAGRILLRSYAPQIPAIQWKDGMRVLGVVVKTIIDDV